MSPGFEKDYCCKVCGLVFSHKCGEDIEKHPLCSHPDCEVERVPSYYTYFLRKQEKQDKKPGVIEKEED
jgi:hypothetical protein